MTAAGRVVASMTAVGALDHGQAYRDFPSGKSGSIPRHTRLPAGA